MHPGRKGVSPSTCLREEQRTGKECSGGAAGSGSGPEQGGVRSGEGRGKLGGATGEAATRNDAEAKGVGGRGLL